MEYQDYILLREDILSWIGGRLKASRIRHTLGVEQTAVSMARQYHEDPQAASLAGLLHDNAKNLDISLQLSIARRAYPDMEFSMEYSSVLHAFAGASEARNHYPQLSSDIINAICYHTTGRPEMSRLEKIIYCADYIEPNRPDFPGLKESRALVFQDLDRGLYQIMCQTTDYVVKRGKQMHPLTLQALSYYHQYFSEHNLH